MREKLTEKIDSFFKEMGLEEEVKKLSDMFAEQYMIKGEETEDLKEALHRAPDSLIDMIWGNVSEEEPDEELSRRQKEERLYQDISEYFASRFELLDVTKINLLMRIANYYPIDAMEGASATREFAPYGWVFSLY